MEWIGTRTKKESKYLGDEYVKEDKLCHAFPNILAKITALGLQFVFVNQGECNLSLVREFQANWNNHHV